MSEVSKQEVVQPFYEILFFMSIIFLIVFMLSALYVHQFVKKLDGPFQALLQGTKALRYSQYQHRIDESIFKSSVVEFQSLYRSYNDMATELEIEQQRRAEAEQRMMEANKKLEALSLEDGLTHLSNRRAFNQDLEQLIGQAKNEQVPLSLLMMDVDHFKAYNDHYGHEAGDQALVQVAKAVRKVAGSFSLGAYRYGGEELAVLFPPEQAAAAEAVGEAIITEIAALQLPHFASNTGYVTASLGTAIMTPAAATAKEELIQTADGALYQSKRSGRNCQTVVTRVFD